MLETQLGRLDRKFRSKPFILGFFAAFMALCGIGGCHEAGQTLARIQQEEGEAIP